MKRFGFGRRVMESRILTEVEEMISGVREKRGRQFDVRQLATSCVVNVVMSMLFGRRFDHSEPALRQYISNAQYLNVNFTVVLHLFPALRFLPRFRRSIADKIEAAEKNCCIIDDNIAACTEVPNCCLTIVLFSFNNKYQLSLSCVIKTIIELVPQ